MKGSWGRGAGRLRLGGGRPELIYSLNSLNSLAFSGFMSLSHRALLVVFAALKSIKVPVLGRYRGPYLQPIVFDSIKMGLDFNQSKCHMRTCNAFLNQ